LWKHDTINSALLPILVLSQYFEGMKEVWLSSKLRQCKTNGLKSKEGLRMLNKGKGSVLYLNPHSLGFFITFVHMSLEVDKFSNIYGLCHELGKSQQMSNFKLVDQPTMEIPQCNEKMCTMCFLPTSLEKLRVVDLAHAPSSPMSLIL